MRASAWLLLVVSIPTLGYGEIVDATPSDYEQKLGTLEPGDTLRLTPGTYERLSLSDLHGAPSAWITIEGPASGSAAVVTGNPCCNTVQIRRCSYVAVRNLTIDSGGVAALDGINAKDGASHHILIENNRIQGVGGSQQTVGISTKSTSWGWIIRGNIISEPGTGIYLGNSDGSAPFIGGVIEGNLIVHPEGYAMQIKHQNPYDVPEAVGAGKATLIRHNVFAKDDRPSGDGDRPVLLVGGFPDSGQGSDHRYEIYGNFLFNNPRESLIQATGSVAIHDNVLVGAGAGQTAIYLTDHNGELRQAHVYNNTIFGGAGGIRFASAAREAHSVIGNAVFAAQPISGSFTNSEDNVTGAVDDADDHFAAPGFEPGSMDFYPQSGQLQGPGLSYPSIYSDHLDHDRDFNGADKGALTFRGAYAGDGVNPGWTLDLSRKPIPNSGASVPEPPILNED